jgi:adenylate cyclase
VAQPHYRILEVLGRGGMGEVCLADDLTLQRQVALKFLTTVEESDALDRLLNEARAAAALDHPFICSIYEIADVDGRPCIAMEYVRGETLERRLRRGPPELAECLRIADEIAEALEAAHNRRIVHGDLKPANVMLTAGQHIKVMDFGLATRLGGEDGMSGDEADDMGQLRGTPAYMAPEQIRGGAADRRSDIFSFGILLCELLTGANPFVRSGVVATLAAIVEEEVGDLSDRVPSIPKTVSAVAKRLLAKDPAARYQSFGGVRTDLRRLAADFSAPRAAMATLVVDRPDEGGSLVGRAAEQAQILQAIELAAAKRGSIVLVSGEAGIGKTRLAEDALNAARRLGFQTLVGRCYEEEGTPPLVPYIAVLEQASRLMPPPAFHQAIEPSAPELAKLLPELSRLFPGMAVPLEVPPALRQRFLFTNYLEFLSRASSFAPIAIFIDDLQWADESTLQLTQHLAEQLAALPVVIVAAYRDVEAPAASKGKLQNLLDRVRRSTKAVTPQVFKTSLDRVARERHARSIVLHPFDEHDVRRLLGELAQQEPPPRLVGTFVDHTGGNPFFIAELFRHLNEEGLLFDERRKWKRGVALDGIDVPESVRAVLERRLERVSDDTQKVLRAAAVIGPSFKLELLEAVANVDNDTLINALDEAERARLLKGPSGRQEVAWRFAHRLICQMLTGSVPQIRRQQLHLRVADSMTRLDAPTRAYTSEIAHHLYCAGHLADSSRTARALVTAGDAAHAVYATEEAIGHYVRALELLDAGGGDESARHDVEERLADLEALTGEHAAAMTRYQKLARTHESRRSPEGAKAEFARVVRKIGMLHWHAGDRSEAMTCYRRALDVVDGLPAHIEMAHLFQELGLAAFRSGNNREAIDWCERAVQSADLALADASSTSPGVRKEATAALAHATNTIGVALARTGQLDAARERIERSLNAARETGLLEVACRAYANLGVLYSTVEPKRAIDVSIAGLEIAAKMAAARLQSYLYANLAAAYCALTDQCETEGLQAAQAAIRLDRELGQLDHLAVPLIVMAQIYQCRGDLEQARQAYDEALMLAERIGEPQLILPCYDGLATICLDRGDVARAEQYLEKARQLCQQSSLDPDATLLLPFLC